MPRLGLTRFLLPKVQVCVPSPLTLLVKSFLLNLDELFLHGVVCCAEDWGWEHGEAFLLEDVVNLSVLAADVKQQLVLLLEHGVAQAAPQVVHQTRELLSKLLHEVATAMLLQLVQSVHLLLANLTFQLVVTVRFCPILVLRRL